MPRRHLHHSHSGLPLLDWETPERLAWQAHCHLAEAVEVVRPVAAEEAHCRVVEEHNPRISNVSDHTGMIQTDTNSK